MLAKDPLSFDPVKETGRTTSFIKRRLKESGARGVVVALSGGIDSAVVGALCVRALGKEKVLGLFLPSEHTPSRDLRDAQEMATYWGIETIEIPIGQVVSSIASSTRAKGDKLAVANLQARVRMLVSYCFANSRHLLVAGTGDRSEFEIGYFTKWGDGGVDFLPIVHLYKTQVRELGRYLGLPSGVVTKPASPNLWPGHTADDELPVGYDKLDPLLYWLFQKKLKPNDAAAKAGVSASVASRTLQMHRLTAHKRMLPASLLTA